MAANDFRQTLSLTGLAPIFGPLPLEPGPEGTAPAEVVLPTTNPPMPNPPSGGEADIFAHYGYGNITAAVIAGVLVIRGDGGNNRLNIYSSTSDT